MKYSLLSDIYNVTVGDKVIISIDATVISDIYAELITNNKWASVLEHVIDRNYIVEIINPTTLKNRDIVEHITLSDYSAVIEEENRMTLKIPDHINQNSLRSAISRKCKGCSINYFEEYLILTKKVDSFNKNILNEAFNTGDIKTINKGGCKNVTSTISHLYKLASQMGITIGIKNSSRALIITHRGMVDTTVYTESFTSQLTRWLKDLPYDMTVPIPTRFTDMKSSAYINTVINKSKYTCKVYAGMITKVPACLKKKNGKIQLIVNEKVIKVINKPSLTNLNSRDRKLINLALSPFKLTYEDIR